MCERGSQYLLNSNEIGRVKRRGDGDGAVGLPYPRMYCTQTWARSGGTNSNGKAELQEDVLSTNSSLLDLLLV